MTYLEGVEITTPQTMQEFCKKHSVAMLYMEVPENPNMSGDMAKGSQHVYYQIWMKHPNDAFGGRKDGIPTQMVANSSGLRNKHDRGLPYIDGYFSRGPGHKVKNRMTLLMSDRNGGREEGMYEALAPWTVLWCLRTEALDYDGYDQDQFLTDMGYGESVQKMREGERVWRTMREQSEGLWKWLGKAKADFLACAEEVAPKGDGYMRITEWRETAGGSQRVRATYGMHYIQGNSLPYFSVTGDVQEKGDHGWTESGGGCCHEAISELFPELVPLIRWHLVDQTGVPSHYMANALYYWKTLKSAFDEAEPWKPESKPGRIPTADDAAHASWQQRKDKHREEYHRALSGLTHLLVWGAFKGDIFDEDQRDDDNCTVLDCLANEEALFKGFLARRLERLQALFAKDMQEAKVRFYDRFPKPPTMTPAKEQE
jgi:hypothetical protein